MPSLNVNIIILLVSLSANSSYGSEYPEASHLEEVPAGRCVRFLHPCELKKQKEQQLQQQESHYIDEEQVPELWWTQGELSAIKIGRHWSHTID